MCSSGYNLIQCKKTCNLEIAGPITLVVVVVVLVLLYYQDTNVRLIASEYTGTGFIDLIDDAAVKENLPDNIPAIQDAAAYVPDAAKFWSSEAADHTRQHLENTTSIKHDNDEDFADCSQNLRSRKLEQYRPCLDKMKEKAIERQSNSTRPCTFALLREVNSRSHYFPTGGVWETVGETYLYQPNSCKFQYGELTKSFMNECIARSGLESILVMGDSTAKAHFEALQTSSKMTCQINSHERATEDYTTPDKDYFTRGLEAEVANRTNVTFRFCSKCYSMRGQCIVPQSDHHTNNLTTEYIAQTMILDDSIQINFKHFHDTKGIRRLWALTSQEFTFRYFLKDRYPDLFLIFLPFTHAKRNMDLTRIDVEMRYFKSLVEYYFPDTTRLIYFPAYSEFDGRRTREGRGWVGAKFSGLLARDIVEKFNQVLYTVIERDILQPDSRTHSFLDMFQASLPRAEWSTDGVHMVSQWYTATMEMFWLTYCNSVLLDQF